MTRRPPVSLNTLSFDAAFALVRDALRRGIHLTALYVDTVGDPDRYAMRLRSTFPSIDTVVVAKKADATYRVVGAASIAAKCKRDHDLRAWVFEEEGGGVLPLEVMREGTDAAAEGEAVAAERGAPTPEESAAAAVATAGVGNGALPPTVAVPNGGSVVWDEGNSDEEGEADGEWDGGNQWRPSAAGRPTADDQPRGSHSAGAVATGTAAAAAAARPPTLTFGRAFGSGYPGDGVTKAWLATHVDPVFGFPSLVRFSWSEFSLLGGYGDGGMEWGGLGRGECARGSLGGGGWRTQVGHLRGCPPTQRPVARDGQPPRGGGGQHAGVLLRVAACGRTERGVGWGGEEATCSTLQRLGTNVSLPFPSCSLLVFFLCFSFAGVFFSVGGTDARFPPHPTGTVRVLLANTPGVVGIRWFVLPRPPSDEKRGGKTQAERLVGDYWLLAALAFWSRSAAWLRVAVAVILLLFGTVLTLLVPLICFPALSCCGCPHPPPPTAL